MEIKRGDVYLVNMRERVVIGYSQTCEMYKEYGSNLPENCIGCPGHILFEGLEGGRCCYMGKTQMFDIVKSNVLKNKSNTRW